jgi:hypothetical protein
MPKKLQRNALIILIVLAIGAAYMLGGQQGENGNHIEREHDYEQGLSSLRAERDKVFSDYESACFRYQELYAAYDELYTKVGTASGLQKVARPDGARGNEDSCYR